MPTNVPPDPQPDKAPRQHPRLLESLHGPEGAKAVRASSDREDRLNLEAAIARDLKRAHQPGGSLHISKAARAANRIAPTFEEQLRRAQQGRRRKKRKRLSPAKVKALVVREIAEQLPEALDYLLKERGL
jgi:hypothetical protein